MPLQQRFSLGTLWCEGISRIWWVLIDTVLRARAFLHSVGVLEGNPSGSQTLIIEQQKELDPITSQKRAKDEKVY